MNTFALKALAAASLSLFAIAPAAAEDVRVTVEYADLDLASPAGAEALAGRLHAGIKAACVRPSLRDVKAAAAWDACKDAAAAEAAGQLARRAAVHG